MGACSLFGIGCLLPFIMYSFVSASFVALFLLMLFLWSSACIPLNFRFCVFGEFTPYLLICIFSSLYWFPACIASSSCSFCCAGFQLVLQARLALFDLIYFLHLIKKKNDTTVSMHRSFIEILNEQLIVYLMVRALNTQLLKSFPILGKCLSMRLLNPTYFFLYIGNSRCWEILLKEDLLHAIPSSN